MVNSLSPYILYNHLHNCDSYTMNSVISVNDLIFIHMLKCTRDVSEDGTRNSWKRKSYLSHIKSMYESRLRMLVVDNRKGLFHLNVCRMELYTE